MSFYIHSISAIPTGCTQHDVYSGNNSAALECTKPAPAVVATGLNSRQALRLAIGKNPGDTSRCEIYFHGEFSDELAATVTVNRVADPADSKKTIVITDVSPNRPSDFDTRGASMASERICGDRDCIVLYRGAAKTQIRRTSNT